MNLADDADYWKKEWARKRAGPIKLSFTEMMLESDYRAITATTRERWSFTSTARLTARLSGRRINFDDECKHGRYLLCLNMYQKWILFRHYKICILKTTQKISKSKLILMIKNPFKFMEVNDDTSTAIKMLLSNVFSKRAIKM